MKTRRLVLCLVGLLLLPVIGCEDDGGVSEPGPPVVITSVSAFPDSVTLGGLVFLSAEATGENLTFEWTAPAGTFLVDGKAMGSALKSVESTATWKAPDEARAVRIVAVVSNDEGEAAKSVVVGVETYVPDVVPYYLGAATCGECHGNEAEFIKWQGTAHAHAWETLIDSGQSQPSCYGCHSVGVFDLDDRGDPLDNGGYDELPIEALENVQCESCHGPLGDPDGQAGIVNHDFLRRGEALFGLGTEDEPAGCGNCHVGSHFPYVDEWRASAHATSADHASVIDDPQCTPCHVAQAYVDRFVHGGEAGVYGDESLPIACIVCHDPHDPTHPGQLRSASADFLCGDCHTAEEALPGGTPHHPQVDILKGEGAHEYPGVTYGNTIHWDVTPERCTTCHVYTTPYVSEFEPPFTSHDGAARPQNCVRCHPSAAGAETLEEFDVLVEAREELNGLLARLSAELRAATPADSLTEAFRNADFNYALIVAGGDLGAHNFLYERDVIQASIDDFEPTGGRAERVD